MALPLAMIIAISALVIIVIVIIILYFVLQGSEEEPTTCVPNDKRYMTDLLVTMGNDPNITCPDGYTILENIKTDGTTGFEPFATGSNPAYVNICAQIPDSVCNTDEFVSEVIFVNDKECPAGWYPAAVNYPDYTSGNPDDDFKGQFFGGGSCQARGGPSRMCLKFDTTSGLSEIAINASLGGLSPKTCESLSGKLVNTCSKCSLINTNSPLCSAGVGVCGCKC